MRIFNWVHRRLTPKDGLSHQNLRKDDDQEGILHTEADTKALLHENPKLYHGWNGTAGAGILSIGTFGMLEDELSFMINDDEQHKECLGFLHREDDRDKWDVGADQDDDEWEEEDDDEEEDEKTMMSAEGEENSQEENDEEAEGEWNPLLYDRNSNGKGSIDDSLHSLNNFNFNYYEEEEANKKKERITLADLFSAESDHDDPQHYLYCSSSTTGTTKLVLPLNHNSKHSSNSKKLPATSPPPAVQKNGLLFVKKKLIPRVKEDSRPIQKLHGLMKRMLKRKIHPDINVEGKIKPCFAATATSSEPFGFTKSVSLCQVDGDATSHQVWT